MIEKITNHSYSLLAQPALNFFTCLFPATLILFPRAGDFSLPPVPPDASKIDVCRFAFNLVSFDRLWLSESNNTPPDQAIRSPPFPRLLAVILYTPDSPRQMGSLPSVRKPPVEF